MKLAAVSLALLFGAVALNTQTPKNRPAPTPAPKVYSFNSPVYVLALAGSGCPVWMRLRQTAGGRTDTVQDGKRVEQQATRLDLTVTPHPAWFGIAGMEGPGSKHGDAKAAAPPAAQIKRSEVKSATITVHGFDGRQRVVPIGAQAVNSGTATAGLETVWPGPSNSRRGDSAFTRKLDVNFTPAGGRGATAEVWVNGIGAVNWIDVDSIVYADGATWKPAAGESCSIKPDPLELISAH
ncbi:MAG: hypothetical protein ACRD3N_09980 [Terracidiphilus sp.]